MKLLGDRVRGRNGEINEGKWIIGGIRNSQEMYFRDMDILMDRQTTGRYRKIIGRLLEPPPSAYPLPSHIPPHLTIDRSNLTFVPPRAVSGTSV